MENTSVQQPQTSRDVDQAFLEIVYLFIVPVVLIYVGVIPHSWRLLVLAGVLMLIWGIIRYQHWTNAQLGLAKPFTFRAILSWGIFTLVGVIAIIAFAKHFDFHPLNLLNWSESWRLILFFIPISVLQEVAYRAFLTERLKEFSFSLFHRTLLNAVLFALLHIIYPYAAITLPVAFIGGFLFSLIYERHPDLVLACIAHCILNFTAVLFGIFS